MGYSTSQLIVFTLSLATVTAIYSSGVTGLTRGQVWPLPRYISTYKSQGFLDPEFQFKVVNYSCDILEEAVKRYSNVIKGVNSGDCKLDQTTKPLHFVSLQLKTPCEKLPHHEMNEQYELHIFSPGHENDGLIASESVWGMLRGMESFSQLVIPSTQPAGCLVVNSTDILDYPRFPHRGLLIDSSRHYLPLSVIMNILSAMEMNKMNVLHWHIVDDQSFPYQSSVFPSVSGKGAYSENLVYTKENITKVVDYARLRAIRVIPEFDTPGHTDSWGKGVSKLLTPCYTDEKLTGYYGIDPTRPQNYKFIKSLLAEVKSVFPDDFIHLGGDEVDFTCWESNPLIQQFMREHNITNSTNLENYYFSRVFEMVDNLRAKGIVWQEVFLNRITVKNDTVIHIWTNTNTASGSDLLNQVTEKGFFALLSAGWYLDHLGHGGDWTDFYQVDPTDFNGSTAQKDHVLGGEACMWGESVDETNIVSRIWPRASATAERLWSHGDVDNVTDAVPRLNEHICRMKRRGVAASPIGPGFCPY